jgi:hypothetical protein
MYREGDGGRRSGPPQSLAGPVAAGPDAVGPGRIVAFLSRHPDAGKASFGLGSGRTTGVLRKEVIQPQVLLRLPCYDLIPVAGFTVGATLPPEGGLGPRLRVPPAPMI